MQARWSEGVETLPGLFADPPVRLVVWATDNESAQALLEAVRGPGREITILDEDADLGRLGRTLAADLLIANDGPRFAAQAAFVRTPFILVKHGALRPEASLAAQAYALAMRPAEAGLAVDRFLEHRALAERARARREPPHRCSRCGRGYDPAKGRSGRVRRFVRFGSISLCGGCVEELRHLLAHAETSWVEAEVRR